MKLSLITLTGIVALSANLPAQTYTLIHSFTNSPDGRRPQGALLVNDGTLYGTTWYGGAGGNGCVFKVGTDGAGYSVLKSLDAAESGINPEAAPILAGDMLDGTTRAGGSSADGTVFKINTNGTGFTVLKSFAGDGSTPIASLVLNGNTLYGTTSLGGSSNYGTIFKIGTNGTGFGVLKHFTGIDGVLPESALVLDAGVLYGTTTTGGSSNGGTVFKINTDGTGFTLLKEFNGTDGFLAAGDLTLSGGMLYGATAGGGSANNGTLFRLTTNGTGFAVIKEFSARVSLTNSDGSSPNGSLVLSGNALYGTTQFGGAFTNGTLYKVNTDGSGFKVIKHFARGIGDGNTPLSGMVLDHSTLYGTVATGGSLGYGAVFGLTMPPEIVTTDSSFGVKTNSFGFNVTGLGDATVVIEVCAALGSDWQPFRTNTLAGGFLHFSDSGWTGHPTQFYRARLQ